MRKSKKYRKKTFNVFTAILELLVEVILFPFKIIKSILNIIDEIRS